MASTWRAIESIERCSYSFGSLFRSALASATDSPSGTYISGSCAEVWSVTTSGWKPRSTRPWAIHAAAPCPRKVKEEMFDWWGPVIYEYYGATEGGDIPRYKGTRNQVFSAAEGLRAYIRTAPGPVLERRLDLSDVDLDRLHQALQRALERMPNDPPMPSVRSAEAP